MNIAFKTVYASIFFLLVLSIPVHATPQVLPIINQNEFQSCIWGWCQTVAPAWLYTDFNTSTNIYNITNSTIFNTTNIYQGANISSITCGGTDKISALDNATGIATCSADQIGLTSESEPSWNGNYSSVAFTANQGDWDVNSSNISNYCVNVLDGSYCYNESYDPFETGKNCSQTWNNSCNSTTLDDTFKGSAGLNGTQPNGCNGTQNSSNSINPEIYPHVTEIYINQTNFYPNSPINATCEFQERKSSGTTNFEYLWYYNSSNWINIQNWNYTASSTTETHNRSVVFNLNSSEETHIVRCIISWNFSALSGGQISNECANATYSNYYDNDDINFTVTENYTGNLTHEVCANSIQNITVSNSMYLNDHADSYFYPYSNPFNYINNSANDSYYLNSNPYGFYNSTTLPTDDDSAFYPYSNPFNFVNSTYNSTYDTFVAANVSAISNNSIHAFGKTENNLNVNNSVYCNGGACLAANANNVSNNTLFFNGQNGGYWWNITGGIPFTNLTGFDLNKAWTGSLGLGNISINQDLNMSIYNTTRYLPSSSSTVCDKDYNGTTLLWCDCFNTTNKWMANTC